MKSVQTLAALLTLLTLVVPAEAKFFSCKAVGLKFGERTEHTTLPLPSLESEKTLGGDVGLLFLDQLAARCKSSGERYELYFAGLSGALHFNNSYFTLSCPLVGKRRFDKEKGARFIGVRITAVAGVGANAGVFMNHAFGTCVLTGASVGVGAGAAIGALTIRKLPSDADVQSWSDAVDEL